MIFVYDDNIAAMKQNNGKKKAAEKIITWDFCNNIRCGAAINESI